MAAIADVAAVVVAADVVAAVVVADVVVVVAEEGEYRKMASALLIRVHPNLTSKYRGLKTKFENFNQISHSAV